MTATLLAVHPVIALASVGKAITNIIVAIMKTIAVFDRRPRFNVKSLVMRIIERQEASLCIKLIQKVRYVMGAFSIDTRT